MPKIQQLTRKNLIAIIQTDLWDEGRKFPRGYFKKDVKMAVEWFKVQMSYLKKVHKYPAKDVYKYMCKKVEEAFLDLYPPKRRRA